MLRSYGLHWNDFIHFNTATTPNWANVAWAQAHSGLNGCGLEAIWTAERGENCSPCCVLSPWVSPLSQPDLKRELCRRQENNKEKSENSWNNVKSKINSPPPWAEQCRMVLHHTSPGALQLLGKSRQGGKSQPDPENPSPGLHSNGQSQTQKYLGASSERRSWNVRSVR